MKVFFVLLVTGAAMLAQTPPPAKSAPAATPAAKAPVSNPLLHPETLKARAPDEFKVKFTTTKGDFVMDVHRDWSPLGADRFYNLVKNRFYTNAAFFRIVPHFVVQFGMAADPKVGAVWQGGSANIKDDPMKPTIHNKVGTVVFAKTSEPNSRTTQLFININDNTQSLDPQGFSPFAEVTEGMDVVMALNGDYGERPQQAMILSEGKAYLDKNFPKIDFIKSATIETAPGAAITAPAAAKSAPAATKSTAAPAAKK